jgi:hypothetical protein
MFHNLYWTPKYGSGDISRKIETHTRIWWEKHEGNRPVGRPKSKWVYNIKVNLNGVKRKGVEWIHITQERD